MTSKDDGNDKRDSRLKELADALKEAQLMLLKQSQLLESVNKDETDSAKELAQMREQVAVITAERDQLQDQLLALEHMQTETVALSDDAAIVPAQQAPLPTIDDLMTDLGALSEESVDNNQIGRLGGPSAEKPENQVADMISPSVIAPEEFANRPSPGLQKNEQPSRLLIYVGSEQPVRIPLQIGTMTIGRANSANIRLDGSFVSRIHARIITRPEDTVIEDAGSKNGFKVNSRAVGRHTLCHGDVINIGQRRFTFVDKAQEN
ncbi:MAG: FHA domain-containing protein [Gammaproteobacteria bacterium]|nr:FHA domain-containing protein [Gammaproteobacteria bacterium]